MKIKELIYLFLGGAVILVLAIVMNNRPELNIFIRESINVIGMLLLFHGLRLVVIRQMNQKRKEIDIDAVDDYNNHYRFLYFIAAGFPVINIITHFFRS